MKMILFVAALSLTGCKKKSETTAAAGPSCADAIATAVGAMPGGSGAGDVQAQLKGIMTNRCTQDKWPADVITCYSKATDMMSMKKCREMLPADKQQALMTEIRGVMMGAAGAGGGPMHGAPSGSAAPAEPAPAGSAAPAGSGEPPK